MRWLLLPVLLCLAVATASERCIVTDFYALSWIGDPSLRHSQLSMWLTTNGNSCSTEQLLVIWNNLPMWAGTADSSEVRAKLLYFFAKAAEREKK